MYRSLHGALYNVWDFWLCWARLGWVLVGAHRSASLRTKPIPGFWWARTEVHSFEPNQFRIISTQDSYAVPFSLCVRVCALSFVASS